MGDPAAKASAERREERLAGAGNADTACTVLPLRRAAQGAGKQQEPLVLVNVALAALFVPHALTTSSPASADARSIQTWADLEQHLQRHGWEFRVGGV